MTIHNAEGKLLIATPRVTNKLFNKSVIYIHTDDDTGTIGVMLNCPMDNDMAVRWANDINWAFPERIHHGGPVERQLGYVIHSDDYSTESTVTLNNSLCYTGGTSIVIDINRAKGPNKFLLVTGYCQWQPKQLETEVQNNMWNVVDFDEDYFFQDLDREHGWEFAVNIAAQNKTTKLLDMVDTA